MVLSSEQLSMGEHIVIRSMFVDVYSERVKVDDQLLSVLELSDFPNLEDFSMCLCSFTIERSWKMKWPNLKKFLFAQNTINSKNFNIFFKEQCKSLEQLYIYRYQIEDIDPKEMKKMKECFDFPKLKQFRFCKYNNNQNRVKLLRSKFLTYRRKNNLSWRH